MGETMKIKDILAKIAKGETLTDAEKAFLADYDPDRDVNSAAAAARKKAESDAEKAIADAAALKQQLADAQAKLEDSAGKGKTEVEKLAAQVATLTQQVQASQVEKAKLIRQQKLDDVIRTSGLQFVKEVDGGIMRGALVNEFGSLSDEDLADEGKVKPVIETFRARNKAVILDTSGSGTGMPPHRPEVPVGTNGKPVDQMTAEERQKDLKQRGIIG
jgi:multidrug efflux pump subunit AcrA (membrane-fusion protein)